MVITRRWYQVPCERHDGTARLRRTSHPPAHNFLLELPMLLSLAYDSPGAHLKQLRTQANEPHLFGFGHGFSNI
jgi:hypothetical protein